MGTYLDIRVNVAVDIDSTATVSLLGMCAKKNVGTSKCVFHVIVADMNPPFALRDNREKGFAGRFIPGGKAGSFAGVIRCSCLCCLVVLAQILRSNLEMWYAGDCHVHG